MTMTYQQSCWQQDERLLEVCKRPMSRGGATGQTSQAVALGPGRLGGAPWCLVGAPAYPCTAFANEWLCNYEYLHLEGGVPDSLTQEPCQRRSRVQSSTKEVLQYCAWHCIKCISMHWSHCQKIGWVDTTCIVWPCDHVQGKTTRGIVTRARSPPSGLQLHWTSCLRQKGRWEKRQTRCAELSSKSIRQYQHDRS